MKEYKEPNQPSSPSGTSGLYQAVIECRYQQVKFFLDSGVRLSKRGGNVENVLLAALQIDDDARRRKMFNYLLKRGANYWDADGQTGRSTLIWAAYMNRTAQVNRILRFAAGGVDVAGIDNNGVSCLHYATSHGNLEMVRLIIKAFVKYGLSVDIQDKEGLTPYLHAKRLGYGEIANLLEAEGKASVNQADGKLFRSVDGWKKAGLLKRENEEKKLAKIYGSTSLRVLPELDPRGLYRTKTSMVPRNTTTHISFSRKAYTLPEVYKKSSVDNLRSILKYKNEKTVLFPDGQYKDEILTQKKTKTVHISEQNSIRHMMDILSDQICDSYRDPALEKIQETIQETKKNPQRKNTSTLAAILAKVKHKSDEMEKRDKLKRELDRHTRIVKKRHTVSIEEKSLRPQRKVRIQLPPM